jgi:hypothetical protein
MYSGGGLSPTSSSVLPLLPPVYEQMVGVERTGPGRSASVQPWGSVLHLQPLFLSRSSCSYLRGSSMAVLPHDFQVAEGYRGWKGRKRSGMV